MNMTPNRASRQQIAVANCPLDGCPMRPFATVKAPLGFTISLHGCYFCNFDHVVVTASDAGGKTRLVAQWSYIADSGVYILVKEYGRNSPGWIELTCSALPQREQ